MKITNKNVKISYLLSIDEFSKFLKNDRFIPVSEWNFDLKNAEDLYLIGQHRFALIKCDELFISILHKLLSGINIQIVDIRTKNELVNQIQKISVAISSYAENIIDNRLLNCENDNFELIVEQYISYLKKILIKIKSRNSNNQSESKKKIKNDQKLDIKIQKQELSEIKKDLTKNSSNFYWTRLIEAIVKFENSS